MLGGQLRRKKNMDTPAYVITLVHGTFAREAEWILSEAEFCRIIGRELPERCVFKPFQWSGDNNHQARFDAATALAKDLLATLNQYPTSRHFVIAHSHGGNIALAAQGHWAVKGKLAGIITLGTPFISCAPRKVNLGIEITFTSLGILFIAIIMLVYAITIFHLVWNGTLRGGLMSAIYGGLLLIFNRVFFGSIKSAWSLFSDFCSGRLNGFVKTTQQRASRRFFLSTSHLPPVICFSVSDDEAGRWLALLRKLGNFGPAVSAGISNMFPWLIALVQIVLLLTVIVGLFGKSLALVIMVIPLAVSICLLVLAAIMFMLVLVITIVSQRAIRAHRFGFGGETILDNLFSDISISDFPLNAPTVTRVATYASGGLRHSSYYKDPAIARCIAHWIEYIDSPE
jgi:pimeloyl-ACP methyl ester carboxylesterase